MLAYEPPLNPSCNEWNDYLCPIICAEKIKEVCADILKRGERTNFQKIYDVIYELVHDDIEDERKNDYQH